MTTSFPTRRASELSPVDRIDRAELKTCGEVLVVERGLHHCLGVVETALDRDIMDVGGEHGRHLAALDVGDAARRVEHEHVDMLAPRQRVDRRRSGVAAGRADSSEERRVGNECVSTCKFRWSPYHYKQIANIIPFHFTIDFY